MKKVFGFTICFLLITKMSLCQSITLDELIHKTKCKDFTCYNSYMLSKEFSLVKDTTINTFKIYEYKSDRLYDVGKYEAYHLSSISFDKYTSEVNITLNTLDKSLYLAVLKKLEQSDFINTTVPSKEGRTTTLYDNSVQNKDIWILIVIFTNEGELNRYTITVGRD